MVGNWNGEECRDKEEEGDKGQLGPRFQVVETLIGGLSPSQVGGSEKASEPK